MRTSAAMGYVYAKRGWLYVGFRGRDGQVQVATGLRDTAEGREQAGEVLRLREAAIEAQIPGSEPVGRLTLGVWIDTWLARHEGEDGWRNDKGRLAHVPAELRTLYVDEVRPRHFRGWILALKKGPLSPRSVRHCYDALRRVLREAHVEELTPVQAWTLLPGDLPAKKDAKKGWRETAIFLGAEVVQLTTDPRVPLDRRTMYAVLALAGLRWGEAAALTWADYDAKEGRLLVSKSWSTERHAVEATKTDTVRLVPVHPALKAALAAWKLSQGRVEPEDLLVPSRLGRHRSVSHGLKKALRDMRVLGLRPRRLYDLRRSFTTALRACGTPDDLVRWITHGRTSDVLDAYTNTPWPALVKAMAQAAKSYPAAYHAGGPKKKSPRRAGA